MGQLVEKLFDMLFTQSRCARNHGLEMFWCFLIKISIFSQQKWVNWLKNYLICLFCFVLIWVSLNCRQAISSGTTSRRWFRLSPLPVHTSMPGLSTKSATVVTKLPLYGNLSLHLTQHQQVKPPFLGNWISNPDTPVSATTVYWTQLCRILTLHTGATPWYSSKYSLRRTGCQWGSSYYTPTI